MLESESEWMTASLNRKEGRRQAESEAKRKSVFDAAKAEASAEEKRGAELDENRKAVVEALKRREIFDKDAPLAASSFPEEVFPDRLAQESNSSRGFFSEQCSCEEGGEQCSACQQSSSNPEQSSSNPEQAADAGSQRTIRKKSLKASALQRSTGREKGSQSSTASSAGKKSQTWIAIGLSDDYDIVPMGHYVNTPTFLKNVGWRRRPFPLDWCAATFKVWLKMLSDNFTTLLLQPQDCEGNTHPYTSVADEIAMFPFQNGWANEDVCARVDRLRVSLEKRRVFGIGFYFESLQGFGPSLHELVEDARTLLNLEAGFVQIVLVWFEKAGTPKGSSRWFIKSDRLSLLRYVPMQPLNYYDKMLPQDQERIANQLRVRFPHVFAHSKRTALHARQHAREIVKAQDEEADSKVDVGINEFDKNSEGESYNETRFSREREHAKRKSTNFSTMLAVQESAAELTDNVNVELEAEARCTAEATCRAEVMVQRKLSNEQRCEINQKPATRLECEVTESRWDDEIEVEGSDECTAEDISEAGANSEAAVKRQVEKKCADEHKLDTEVKLESEVQLEEHTSDVICQTGICCEAKAEDQAEETCKVDEEFQADDKCDVEQKVEAAVKCKVVEPNEMQAICNNENKLEVEVEHEIEAICESEEDKDSMGLRTREERKADRSDEIWKARVTAKIRLAAIKAEQRRASKQVDDQDEVTNSNAACSIIAESSTANISDELDPHSQALRQGSTISRENSKQVHDQGEATKSDVPCSKIAEPSTAKISDELGPHSQELHQGSTISREDSKQVDNKDDESIKSDAARSAVAKSSTAKISDELGPHSLHEASTISREDSKQVDNKEDESTKSDAARSAVAGSSTANISDAPDPHSQELHEGSTISCENVQAPEGAQDDNPQIIALAEKECEEEDEQKKKGASSSASGGGTNTCDANASEERPHYCIAGTWSNWEIEDLKWDEQLRCYHTTLPIGQKGLESFRILLNGDWNRTVYPNRADASPAVEYSICGPDGRYHGMHWTIGKDDKCAKNAYYTIRVFLSQHHVVQAVVWEKSSWSELDRSARVIRGKTPREAILRGIAEQEVRKRERRVAQQNRLRSRPQAGHALRPNPRIQDRRPFSRKLMVTDLSENLGWTLIGHIGNAVGLAGLAHSLFYADSAHDLYVSDSGFSGTPWSLIGHAMHVESMDCCESDNKLVCVLTDASVWLRNNPWQVDLSWDSEGYAPDETCAITVFDKMLYAVSNRQLWVRKLGEKHWKQTGTFDFDVVDMVALDGKLVCATQVNTLVCKSLEDGTCWPLRMLPPLTQAMAYLNGKLYVAVP